MKEKPKEEIGKFLFKTTNDYSKKQILAIIIFAPITILATIAMLYQLIVFDNLSFARTSVTLFLFLFGVFWFKKFIIDTIIRWFKIYFTVELFEDRLVGYNLFGKSMELKFTDIIKIGKKKGIFHPYLGYSICFWDKDNKIHNICGDIDYYGFIQDYILNKVPFDIIDSKWINKTRKRADAWMYTRRSPFDTEYESKYLNWLYEQVQKQKEVLIQQGILKPNVWYGDDYNENYGKKIDK